MPAHQGEAVLLRVAAISVSEMREALKRPGDISDVLIRNAITYAAGPRLLDSAESSASVERRGRAQDTVRRYIARMGGRATPFGLMAGTCLLDIADRTTLRLTGRTGYRVSAFLDIAALEKLVAEQVLALSVRRVPLRVNPTLTRVGDYLTCRKVEPPLDVVRMKWSPAIALALSCCETPCTAAGLVDRLHSRLPSSDQDSITEFVSKLVDHGVLSPDTGLLCPGRTPAQVAADLLARAGVGAGADKGADTGTGDAALAETVARVASVLEHRQPLTPRFMASLDNSWNDLLRQSRTLQAVNTEDRYNLQLGVTCQGTLDRRLVLDLERAAECLAGLFPPPDPLADLRVRFEARYADAAVPVLEVADPERGLLPWPARSRSAIADQVQGEEGPTSPRQDVSRVQLAALDHWLATGTPFDLAATASADRGTDRTRKSGAGTGKPGGALAALVRDPSGIVHSVLSAVGLVGAGALLGRLATSDFVLAEHMRAEIANARDEPGLAVEVMYSPGGRIGNTLIRPHVCADTIALAGATGGTIHPGRLVMRLENDGFAVYDQQTGTRVKLHVNSAYNPLLTRNDPLYVLLAALAKSNSGVRWQWQGLHGLRHLPRVVCGRVIVAAERWLVKAEDISACVRAADPGRELRTFLPGIGRRRWIGATAPSADMVLPVDLDNPDQLHASLRYMSKRGITELVELPHVEHPFVAGPRGRHVAEICVSFSRSPAQRHDAVADTRAISLTVARDEWSYFQLFCGVSAADAIVIRAHELAAALRADGLARQWFFVRYDDGAGYHVRVRVRAAHSRQQATVAHSLSELASALSGEGLVTFTRQEPYVPEVRRYGGPGAIAAAEDFFGADSDSVAEYLGSRPSEIQRLAMASSTVGSWWQDAIGPREKLYRVMRQAQRQLWPGEHWPSKGVGRVWRAYQAEVAKEALSTAALAQGRPEIGPLLSRVPAGSEGRHRCELIASVVHMHCNRLFACDNRRMEALAYEFALRGMLRDDALASRQEDGR